MQIPFRRSGSAAAKWVDWHCEKPSIRLKMAATVGTRYLRTEQAKPAHSAITVNNSEMPLILTRYEELRYFKTARLS